MTALVVSFPQDRIFRDRFAQTEARKAYQIVRRRDPKLLPSELWERALSALAFAACFTAAGERATEAMKTDRDRKLSALNDYEDNEARRTKRAKMAATADPMTTAKLEAALIRVDRIEKEKRLMEQLGIEGPPPSAA